MPRNLFRRIEAAFPIEDGNLRERIISEILAANWPTTSRRGLLQPDGSYRRLRPANGEKPRRSQSEFIALAIVEERPLAAAAAGQARYPRVKLAPSPLAPGGK